MDGETPDKASTAKDVRAALAEIPLKEFLKGVEEAIERLDVVTPSEFRGLVKDMYDKKSEVLITLEGRFTKLLTSLGKKAGGGSF